MANKNQKDTYGRNLGFGGIHDYAKRTRHMLESGNSQLRKAVKDEFDACGDYLARPKEERHADYNEHARISRNIAKRIASNLGLKI